ncbi:MAG: ATP-dependent Clp protease ATP-binding subunit [Clostridia bacterium]|nr:ATP-dependent Clp protease ATP-binding subunit [Clostridia bacterium]
MANYTKGFTLVINNADELKNKFGVSYISTELVLYSVLLTPKCEACTYLNAFGATKDNVYPYLRKNLKQRNVLGLTPKMKVAINEARAISNAHGLTFVSTEHLVLGIIRVEDSKATSILRSLGVDLNSLYSKLIEKSKLANQSDSETTQTQTLEKPENKPVRQIVTPLEGLGFDLTLRAKNGEIDPVIGRTEEIARVIQTLSRKTKNSPVLVGEAGVGKTAVVEGLAQKIASGEAPEFLRDKIVFSLDIASALSGTRYRGDFEERLKKVTDYAVKNKNVIFFIDEIHNIVGAGSTQDGNLDVAELLKPLLARGEISLIGATTSAEYTRFIEKDPALERRFQPITVSEPSIEDSIKILQGIKTAYEAHHKVLITNEAIETAVKLSARYIQDRFLPDKAIDLIDETASKKHVEITSTPQIIIDLENKIKSLTAERDYAMSKKDLDTARDADRQIAEATEKINKEKYKHYKKRSESDGAVTATDVKKLISSWTKIPVTDLSSDDKAKLMSLEDELYKRVIGQSQAIESVARAVRRSRANVNDPDKPIGSFLFVGPTGVGKTELAKALAECVFGDKNSLIRFDMSEYQDKTSINKLIGSAPGYVGYEQEGLLVDKVRKNPYSVVLFDEIEKASPEIYDILLQVMGEGRLTDNKGRLVSFKNAIIILTSNTGYSQSYKKTVGFGGGNEDLSVDDALKSTFKPEFLNRLDEIVNFNRLTENDCYDVADILINVLIARVNSQGYKLFVENSAMDVIVNKGYSHAYGARNIKRVIATEVEDLLSDAIISGEITPGDTVTVYAKNGVVTYKKD